MSEVFFIGVLENRLRIVQSVQKRIIKMKDERKSQNFKDENWFEIIKCNKKFFVKKIICFIRF